MFNWPSVDRLPRALRPAGALVCSLALACASLTACSTGRDYGPEESGPEAFRPLAPAFDKVGYRWDWSGFPAPERGQHMKFLSAWPDAIVTQDTSSKVTVIEPGSGRTRWSGDVANLLIEFVGISRDRPAEGGGRVDRLICSGEAEAFLVDLRTGKLLSRQRYEKLVNTAPLLVGDVAVYGTPTGEVLAHRYTNGLKAWGFQAPGTIEYPPILVGNIIAAISQAGYLSTIDATTGTLVGRNKIFSGLSGPLSTDGALIFAASLDQSLHAFAPSGKKIWQHRTSQPLTYPPVALGTRVYCHTADEGFTAFDAATGRIAWSNKDAAGTLIGTRKGDLLVWNGADLFTLEPDSGHTIDRVSLPHITHIAFDRFDGGVMYVVNRAGVLGRFVPKN